MLASHTGFVLRRHVTFLVEFTGRGTYTRSTIILTMAENTAAIIVFRNYTFRISAS